MRKTINNVIYDTNESISLIRRIDSKASIGVMTLERELLYKTFSGRYFIYKKQTIANFTKLIDNEDIFPIEETDAKKYVLKHYPDQYDEIWDAEEAL